MKVCTSKTNFCFPIEKRPLGRPNITIRHSFISDIGKISSNVDLAGSFNSWAHVAFDESRWTELVNYLDGNILQLCIVVISCSVKLFSTFGIESLFFFDSLALSSSSISWSNIVASEWLLEREGLLSFDSVLRLII